MRYHSRYRTGLGVLRQYTPRPIALPADAEPDAIDRAPSIRLATPSYNQGRFIERTIDSVLGQSYPSLTYLVQDGRSTDDTLERLDPYRDDPRLTVTSEADDGQASAINAALSSTTEELMGWVNSDDLLLPGALNRVGRFFRDHPDVDVVYGHRLLIDRRDREIGRWVLPAHENDILSWADYIPQETMFWRRSLWESVGATLDESFRFALDWDLILRFRSAGARFHRLPFYLGAFRVHGAQKTSSEIETSGDTEMARLRRRELGRDVTELEISRAIRPYLLRATLEHNREQLRRVVQRSSRWSNLPYTRRL